MALPPDRLLAIEQAAETALSHPDSATRRAAELSLLPFRTHATYIAAARMLLDQSNNTYALLLAGQSLNTLLTNFFHTFTIEQTIEIRNYLLNYLANSCGRRPNFVLLPVLKTCARITKLGWRMENAAAKATAQAGESKATADGRTESHKDIVTTASIFFQHSIAHHILGLRLFHELVSEMESAISVESPSDHRRTSRLFRDHALLPITQRAIMELRSSNEFRRAGENASAVEELQSNALSLFSACMSYDFLGSTLDETIGEDSNVTLQLPTTWRPLVEDSTPAAAALLFVQTFEDPNVRSNVQAECINALTCLSSVRRSLFSNDENRHRFMRFIMETQMTFIVKYGGFSADSAAAGGMGGRLREEQVYHEFCRWLGRFKYNYSLNDLVHAQSFELWLEHIFRLTVHNKFANWETTGANSAVYLLGMWSRIAADVGQLKTTDSSGGVVSSRGGTVTQPPFASPKVQEIVLNIIPQLLEVFINARLDSIATLLRESGGAFDANDNDSVYGELFEATNLSDQLRYLSILCRFCYPQMKAQLKQQLDPRVAQYKMLLQSLLQGGGGTIPSGQPHTAAETALQLAIIEAQIAMLVYIIGAIVGCERSLLLLAPQTQFMQQYGFGSGVTERMSAKDRLELLDAELCSWFFALLPIVNVRISSSSNHGNPNLLAGMHLGRKHLSLSIVAFLDSFRKKFLSSLAHSNFSSYSPYSRSSIYGIPSAYAHSDMGESPDSPSASPKRDEAPVPTLDSIAHGPAANIFSRTAYFLQQPLTPILLLERFVQQLFLLLNCCSRDFEIVKETLDVFDALSLNYATSSQLTNLDEINMFLNNNEVTLGSVVSTTNNNTQVRNEMTGMGQTGAGSAGASLRLADLPFLHSTHHPKLQRTFYRILSRLVFRGSNIDHFDKFITPFTLQLTQLSNVPNLRTLPRQMLDQLVLLIHKLRGMVNAINSMAVYNAFFEWFFVTNGFSSLILRIVESFWDDPPVLHPALSFYAELICQRSQRIRFDSNSPNGIILFKETCKIISTYGNRIMMLQRPEDSQTTNLVDAAEAAQDADNTNDQQNKSATTRSNDLYDIKLKGISYVLELVWHSLSGGYINFGIMQYYNDPSLKQCLTLTLQLVMSVRFTEILGFPRIAGNYFHFIESLFRSHLELALQICDSTQFLALISSLHEGLLSTQQLHIMQAANAVEHVMKFMQDKKQDSKPGSSHGGARQQLDRYLSMSGTLLPEILSTLMNLYVFDHIDQHWSLARPILALIVCRPDCLPFYSNRLLQAQNLPADMAAEAQAKIQAAVQGLMQGIQENLDMSNRDRFQQNCTNFKATITSFCTRPL